ncbi:hypothetical protein AVEN_74390-1 [Araneus ventricosus]|uniref:HAT C-terminal dimerisation domain-containing protein n=1 Tax=Araneus ventricosus TaxID=182803 RepID=A0A4Y2LSJ5_ARAVE|nr:hypothetical protein AVEN_74390-1 [Araneus ventricosus]
MVKVGKLMSCYQQLCFAHGLQLAEVDILYKKNIEREEEHQEITYNESDTDDEDTNDTHEEQGVTITTTTDPRNLQLSRVEVIPRYNDLQKVRKVVKLLKRSPAKYDMYLQKYVKEDTGKELSLILDCRTRWNSILAMIERFHKMKVCIDKALIYIGSDTTFSCLEWSKIKDLIESLQPFKLAVEALCRRDSTLLTAETTLKFILEKLVTQDTMLSAELSEAPRVRIKERRTVVTGILIYLQNPKNMMMIQDELMIHLLCRKKIYMTGSEKYLLRKRVIQDDGFNENTDNIVENNLDSSSLKNDLTLQKELQMQIQQDMKTYSISTKKEKDFEKILEKEMTAYESEGFRGKYLSSIHEYLLIIKPSVEAEMAFSAAGYICSSVRSRLADDTISTICFLRSFFQNRK